MSDYEVIRISPEYKARLLDLIAQSQLKNQKDFTEAMIDYFHETGLDPTHRVKNVSGELSKLRNVVVSFIREQEKTKLDPMISQFNDLTEFLLDHFKNKALTKDDLKNLLKDRSMKESKPLPRQIEEPKPEVRPVEVSDNGHYKESLARAKTYFREFTKHFKASTFGGYTIDKKTFTHYEKLFNQLDL